MPRRACVPARLDRCEPAARPSTPGEGEHDMSVGTIILIILIILLIAAIPSWPYSSGWGYGPSGILGVIVIILIILFLFGYRF
jgi:hypothetical protein